MKVNSKKLASLVAAGAGALALTSGKAQAASIIYSNVLDKTIGFSSAASHQTFKTFASIGGPSFTFMTAIVRTPSHTSVFVKARWGAASNFRAAVSTRYGEARRFSAGAVWSNGFPDHGGLQTIAQYYSGRTHPAAYTDEYLLFQFHTDDMIKYGWIEVSLGGGPDVTVVSYAYDSSGAVIAAGDTGVTPEPSSLAESGIAALVLGAEGLRRWRGRRNRLAHL